MQTHIDKWGNSLGLRIPKNLAKKLHLHVGTPVVLDIENGSLVVKTPRFNLDDMLDKITSENLHHIALDDTLKGNEEW
jgi:antitoxin MazE